MERITKPFFHFDPGWLFILSGLALCAAGILLPAQADVKALQRQLEQLRDEESRALARLKAHADFLDQVDRADPALIKRLAAAQLNLVPEGDRPVLRATSNTAPVTNWVDSTVSFDIRPPKPQPVSTLSRWATGPQRLWMFGGGILAVFIGVLLSPAPVRIGRWRRTATTQHNTADQLADDTARHPGFATSTDDDELLEDQDAAACDDWDDDASAAIADDDALESDSLSDVAPDEEDEDEDEDEAEGEDEEEIEEQADDELIDDDSEELLDEAADDFEEEEEVEDEEEYEYEEEDDDAFDDDDSEASAYSDDVLTEDEEDEDVEDEFDELSDDDEASDEDEDNLEDEDESEYFDEDEEDDDSFIAEADDDEDVDGYDDDDDDDDGDDEADMDEDDDQPPFSPTSRW